MRSAFTVLLLLACSSCFRVAAVQPPVLHITNDSPTTVQVEWDSQVDVTYRLLFTEEIDPFSLWSYVTDAYATGTNTAVSIFTTNLPIGFFKLHVLDEYAGLPTARIVSPTNSQVISGPMNVMASAQDDSRLTAVSLFVDGALVGYIESGDLNLGLDTSHFPSGSHTLRVAVRDDADNEVESAPVSVVFDNPVRWIDPIPIFDSVMPIEVESDIYPADWTVFIETLANQTVRILSGSTLDGAIETSWDGKDQNGIDAPVEEAYRITVIVTSQSSQMMMSGAPTHSNDAKIAEILNAYGAVDYEETVVTVGPSFDALVTWSAETEMSEWPPLPPMPPAGTELTTRHISAREMFTRQNQSLTYAGMTTSSASSGGTGSTMNVTWLEAPWQSGQIVLSRQKITGATGILWDSTAASLLNNVRTLVVAAEEGVGSHRGVFQNSILLMQNTGDYAGLTAALASTNPNVRAFYWYGHGTADGNAIGSGNIRATNISQLLGNTWTNVVQPPNPTIQHAVFRKPFNFVFLDGCMTGNGTFPEAFGISKAARVGYFGPGKAKRRAFMGWGGKVSMSILNNDFLGWSQKFWETWLDEAGSYTITVQQAVNAANTFKPGVTNSAPLRIYGTPALTWAE